MQGRPPVVTGTIKSKVCTKVSNKDVHGSDFELKILNKKKKAVVKHLIFFLENAP